MSYQERQRQGRWQDYIRTAPSAYRSLAFTIATAQIFLSSSTSPHIIPPLVLVVAVGIYTLFKALNPFRWHQQGILSWSAFGTDIAVCIFLVILTGGLHSPFLLYTLTPVLTAAVFLKGKVTFGVAGLSGAYVIGGHLGNPFFSSQLSALELQYFLVYMIAVCLAGTLPYLININLRQQMQSEDILLERQRLSREIHDGAAQTVSGLRWQVQLVHRRLLEMGIDLHEVRELVRLAAQAQQDTRECLELLRNYTGDGSFLPHLKDYLEHLSYDSNIGFHLDVETGDLRLEAPVELQLLRLCQEVLTNIRKHSGAHNVQVKVQSVDGHLEVSIADDGCGFDALAYYRDGAQTTSQGLAVMRERAESIGGRLRVLSMPGQGTEVQVEMPVNPHRSRLLWLDR